MSAKAQKQESDQLFTIGLALIVVIGIANWKTPYPLAALAGWLVMFSATLPAIIWYRGGKFGLPLFPIYAALHIPSFGLPLLTGEERLTDWAPAEQLSAAFTVVIFLGAGTIVWRAITNYPKQYPKAIYVIPPGLKIIPIFLSTYVIVSLNTVFLDQGISFNVFGPFRSVIRAFNMAGLSICTFNLFYWYGKDQLNPQQAFWFIILTGFNILYLFSSLLLSSAMLIIIPALIGYYWGRGKLPIILTVVTLLVLILFHYGKGEMREIYWKELQSTPPIVQFPSFYLKWTEASLRNIFSPSEVDQSNKGKDVQNVVERLSLVHFLLLIQDKSPDEIPHLNGATYKIIPALLIPRFLYPSKPYTHLGQQMLNIHYKQQKANEVKNTFISWGHLNEAVANFGRLGALIVGGIIGGVLGWLTLWSQGMPLFSYRVFLIIAMLRSLIGVSEAMSITISTCFQSFIVATGLWFFFMKKVPYATATQESGKVINNITGRIKVFVTREEQDRILRSRGGIRVIIPNQHTSNN
jgi:hypothetical protein